jgi:hypothetical protein
VLFVPRSRPRLAGAAYTRIRPSVSYRTLALFFRQQHSDWLLWPIYQPFDVPESINGIDLQPMSGSITIRILIGGV